MQIPRTYVYRSLTSAALLLCVLLGTMASGKTQSAAEAEKKEVKAKSAGEVASQVCAILANRKTPWQIYRTYTEMFLRFASEQERMPVGTQEAQQQRQRLVLHYRGMAGLLQQMQACAEIRDGIKHNRTDIPFGERVTTYEEQGKRHHELLRQFANMGGKLPGFSPPKESPGKR